jgi:hypothetical protein
VTNETYTGQQFEPVFFEAMDKWFKGGRLGPDPRGEWEFLMADHNLTWTAGAATPSFTSQTYRWRPAPKRTVMIGGKELVAPEREAPAVGDPYFIIRSLEVSPLTWDAGQVDTRYLASGIVFLTRKDAEAMRVAQMQERLG